MQKGIIPRNHVMGAALTWFQNFNGGDDRVE